MQTMLFVIIILLDGNFNLFFRGLLLLLFNQAV